MKIKKAYRFEGERAIAMIEYLQAATKPGEQAAIVILRHIDRGIEKIPERTGLNYATFRYPDSPIAHWDKENGFFPPQIFLGLEREHDKATIVLNPAHIGNYTGALGALALITGNLQETNELWGAKQDDYSAKNEQFEKKHAQIIADIDELFDRRDRESLALRTIALAFNHENPEIIDFGGLKITNPLELDYNAEQIVAYILNRVKEGHMNISAAQAMLNLDKGALKPAQKAIETFSEVRDSQDKKLYPPPMLLGWPIFAKRAQKTLIQWKRLASDSAQIESALENLRATEEQKDE